MREEKLRCFGHVKRRPHTSLVRRVEDLTADGSKRKGKPRLRSEDKLKLDLKELPLSDMISDRNMWRTRTRTNE